MARSPGDIVRWLTAARAGSQEGLGQALDGCRRYLLRVAGQRLDPELRAKGGASDVVQQTFLEAQRDFAQFHGESEDELLAWLRQLLLHNVANFERGYRETDKRQVSREVALQSGDSSTASRFGLAGQTPTPSQEAVRNEEAEALARILELLPDDMRRVIELRHHEQYTFEEIGRAMNRSASGARTLWLRAVEHLNSELDDAP